MLRDTAVTVATALTRERLGLLVELEELHNQQDQDIPEEHNSIGNHVDDPTRNNQTITRIQRHIKL